jgi:hypothetical protein
MIATHIDNEGNKFYTRKELESYEEEFVNSFMEEINLFNKVYEIFIKTIKQLGVNENTKEEDLSEDVKNYLYNTLRKIVEMRNDIIDTYYIDVIVPQEEIDIIMNSKIENIDEIDSNMESIIEGMKAIIINNKQIHVI